MSAVVRVFEVEVLTLLTRIASALERSNTLTEQAMEQRGKMDPALQQMVDAAQELIKRGPGASLPDLIGVLVSDSTRGVCPRTGEPCVEDCGVGNPCKLAGPFDAARKLS